MTKLVMVVDDDEALREVLKLRLEEWGYRVCTAGDATEGQQLFERTHPNIVITDLVMPGPSGLDLLKAIREQDQKKPVILVSGMTDIETAVQAIKIGAKDFLTKPLEFPRLKETLERFDGNGSRQGPSIRKREEKIRSEGCDFGPFIGESEAMREIYDLISEVASTQAPVLISGPSGTGKELVARTIHRLSARADREFLAINAAAIPSELMESELFGHEKGSFTGASSARPGCFEQADGGTLFLDEISEMSANLQAKLLRVLEERRVRRVGGKESRSFDVRVLTATNREPAKAVEEGSLRVDLFYRLNVFNIDLPPLSYRGNDLEGLVQFLVRNFNRRHGTGVGEPTNEAWQLLKDYSWPGNVRELRNVVERAVVLAKDGPIETEHLPHEVIEAVESPSSRVSIPVGAPLDEVQRELILETLKSTGNNKSEAARLLGIDVKTVRNRLKKYGKEDYLESGA